MTGTLNKLKRKNASFAREIEYLREMAATDEADDRMQNVLNNLYESESPVEYREAAELMTELTAEDPYAETEINRILESTHDLTFDEMIGLEC